MRKMQQNSEKNDFFFHCQEMTKIGRIDHLRGKLKAITQYGKGSLFQNLLKTKACSSGERIFHVPSRI